MVPNGTPAPDNGQSAHDRQLGVFLGNFLRRKGVIEAVRAAALVVAREPGARFLFVGDWEDEHLEREARALASVAGPQIQFRKLRSGVGRARCWGVQDSCSSRQSARKGTRG